MQNFMFLAHFVQTLLKKNFWGSARPPPPLVKEGLTLFDMGDMGMMAPHNVFDHCAQTLSRRRLKLGGF